MNIATLLMTLVLLVTLAAPAIAWYAIRQARAGRYAVHRRIQTILFIACITSVIVLEGMIRISGGSGSMVQNSAHVETTLFRSILTAHIIGAVLTYMLWIYLALKARSQYTKVLPGSRSAQHRRLGILVFIGLVYTAVTALIVYLMTLNLI